MTWLHSRTLIKNEYPLSGIVQEINFATDEVIVEDGAGNLWSFFGVEDWNVGDIAAMIMRDMNTKEIADDQIIGRPRYCGNINMIRTSR